MSKGKRLLDAYRFPGFRPRATIKGIFGDPKARVIRLERRQKKQYAAVVADHIGVSTTGRCGVFGTSRAETCGSIWRWRYAGFCVESAAW
jgi:hypothetical protein